MAITIDGSANTVAGLAEGGLPDGKVLPADLKSSSGTAGNTTYYRGDGAWGTVSSVGGATGVDFNDDVEARWGTDNDLVIEHTGGNSWIKHADTGSLVIRAETTGSSGIYLDADNIEFRNEAQNEVQFHADADGAVSLYYNGVKKFETMAHGFKHHGDNTDIQMMVGASANDDVYIKDGSIGFDSGYDGTNTGWISIYGYNGGVTQFRDTKIGNGKGSAILSCIGSSGVVSGDLNDTSDERLKKDIVSIGSEGLTKIKQLRPVSFKWRNTDRNSYGFVAQELETVLPHAVATSETDDNSWTKIQAAATETGAVVVRDTKSINTNSIVAYLVKAVQELSTEVETLKTKVAALEAG